MDRMVKENLIEHVQDYTEGKVTVEVKTFPIEKDGKKKAYEYRNENGTIVVTIDEETFIPADKKIMESLVDNIHLDEKKRTKAEEMLADFIYRQGKYQKIADKENGDRIKEVLKSLTGSKLEALAIVAEGLSSDEAEQLSEEVVNVVYQN